MKRRYISILLITLLLLSSIPQLAYASAVLRTGSRGSEVADMQQRLINLGYLSGRADGIFGPATEGAVKSFQRANGLTVDGIAGPSTFNSLKSANAKPAGSGTPSGGGSNNTGIPVPPSGSTGAVPIQRVLRRGARGSDVAELQNRLNELKYNCGAPDGIFGQGTYNAVVNFQRANNLAADGIVGPATVSMLYSVQSGSGSSPNPPTPNPPPSNPPSPNPDPPSVDIIPGSLKGKIVIIDPGHGGVDSGAYHGGLKEANLALDMGLRLRKMLEQAGATVYMTRSDDRYVSLFYRSAYANKIVLNMEIQSVKGQKEQAGKNISEKQQDISALAEDKARLVAYGESLAALKNAADLQGGTSVQWVLNNMSSQMQLILESKIRKIKEDLNTIGIAYGNKSFQELAAELNEYTGEKQELKAQLLADIEAVIDMTGSAQNIASIEQEISQRNNISSKLSEKVAQAEKLRSALSQKWKDWIYLGNQVLTQENLPELDRMIASVGQAIQQAGAEASKLQQDIYALNNDITGYDSSIAELQRLLNGFNAYFNDPSFNSRTGIYNIIQNGTMHIASNDLKKVMDLTREKYQDKMVFIAIHLNATNAAETSASGVYTFYRNNQPKSNYNVDYYENYNSAARSKFASKLLQEMNKATSFSKKQSVPNIDDFSVLRENNVVSALVEVGFMNNPNDLSLVAQPSFRENAAYGMFRGIEEYFK